MPTRFRCRCCGARTLEEEPNGSYEICDECGWEDDRPQSANPDYAGRANSDSMNDHRLSLVVTAAQEEFWRVQQHGSPTVRLELESNQIDPNAARQWMRGVVEAGGQVHIAAFCDRPPEVVVTLRSTSA